MILFLTSSPTGDLNGEFECEGFDNRNGFADELRQVWPENARVLVITAFPENRAANEEMYEFFGSTIETSGLSLEAIDLWDIDVLENENYYSSESLNSYDVIILGGGHVPTQLEFFRALHLRESIQEFDGIVIGISAGSMDCADVVYAQPEEEGEAIDPDYERFAQGLGITDINILPHYQQVWDNYVDGLHLYRDITLPDSMGNSFLALPDGSYVIQLDNEAWVFGRAYSVENGKMELICRDGEDLRLY